MAKVTPYDPSSPYAGVLSDCVYSNTLLRPETCTFTTLPLLANDTDTKSPRVEDIMNRVLVSHKWMGDRFKTFLEQHDNFNDFKHLLRATTAVVISSDVRPSYYWAATGAIHIDPSYFWVTPYERDTINELPDYRSKFGNNLQFRMLSRYVKNDKYIDPYVPKSKRIDRLATDSVYDLARLLYHELAHANDVFPAHQWFQYTSTERIKGAVEQLESIQSDHLSANAPLNSSQMKALAQVLYRGQQATIVQTSYQPADITGFFSDDIATDSYSYTSKEEDLAMLFDSFMMKARYDIDRDVAITNAPTGSAVYGENYIVDWGQRGRIGEPTIKARLELIMPTILPEFIDPLNVIDDLPAPTPMRHGENWIANLNLSPASSAAYEPMLSEHPNILEKHQRPIELDYHFHEKNLPLLVH